MVRSTHISSVVSMRRNMGLRHEAGNLVLDHFRKQPCSHRRRARRRSVLGRWAYTMSLTDGCERLRSESSGHGYAASIPLGQTSRASRPSGSDNAKMRSRNLGIRVNSEMIGVAGSIHLSPNNLSSRNCGQSNREIVRTGAGSEGNQSVSSDV